MVIDPEAIDWDEVNREHATRHGISVTEINQALRNDPTVRRNRKGRRGDFYAFGVTDGGRKVVVVIAWNPDRRIIRPIMPTILELPQSRSPKFPRRRGSVVVG